MVFPVGQIGHFFQFPADVLRLAEDQRRPFRDRRDRRRNRTHRKGIDRRFRFHFGWGFDVLLVIRDSVYQEIRIDDPGQVAFYFLKVLLDFI